MPRTAFLYLLPAWLIAAGWLRLEGDAAGQDAFWIVLVAALPALAPWVWLRVALVPPAVLVAVHIAFGLDPLEARPFNGRDELIGPFLDQLRTGVLAFSDVRFPFDPARQPAMAGVVLFAIFGFCLAVGLALASRRPLAASLALAGGAAWPWTLAPAAGDLARGALVLLVALGLLLVLSGRPIRLGPAFAAGAAAVAAGFVLSGDPAVARGAFLDQWRTWDVVAEPKRGVGVSYVWNSNYDGIRFPKKGTTVLTVKGPSRSLYWRATTLDKFDGYGWAEDPTYVVLPERDGARDVLRNDPLLPDRAHQEKRWVEQEVTIEGLIDYRLVGASVPIAYEPGDVGAVNYGEGAIAYALRDFRRGDRYRVWSYAPQPSPAQLARSKPNYPGALVFGGRYLQVIPGTSLPQFGTPGRDRFMTEFFENYETDDRVWSYRALYAQARRVIGEARSPYAAVVALETWFRSTGGFVYDEQPPRRRDRPALADFVLRTKRGYCQHFAGAMTLMLRYLGIPARIGAGFTSGRYEPESSTWTVLDRNAHTWVEVWFRGYGWLPFDPTPGRGRLSASYTASSPRFDAAAAQRLVGGSVAARLAELARSRRNRGGEPGLAGERELRGVPAAQRGRGERAIPGLLALLVLVAAGSIVVTKAVVRRARYLTRDPRKLAAACTQDLLDFLRDQRVDVPRSATLSNVATEVQREFAVDAGPCLSALARARFGPLADADRAVRHARRELDALRARLRDRLDLRDRLRGALSLRSLTT